MLLCREREWPSCGAKADHPSLKDSGSCRSPEQDPDDAKQGRGCVGDKPHGPGGAHRSRQKRKPRQSGSWGCRGKPPAAWRGGVEGRMRGHPPLTQIRLQQRPQCHHTSKPKRLFNFLDGARGRMHGHPPPAIHVPISVSVVPFCVVNRYKIVMRQGL